MGIFSHFGILKPRPLSECTQVRRFFSRQQYCRERLYEELVAIGERNARNVLPAGGQSNATSTGAMFPNMNHINREPLQWEQFVNSFIERHFRGVYQSGIRYATFSQPVFNEVHAKITSHYNLGAGKYSGSFQQKSAEEYHDTIIGTVRLFIDLCERIANFSRTNAVTESFAISFRSICDSIVRVVDAKQSYQLMHLVSTIGGYFLDRGVAFLPMVLPISYVPLLIGTQPFCFFGGNAHPNRTLDWPSSLAYKTVVELCHLVGSETFAEYFSVCNFPYFRSIDQYEEQHQFPPLLQSLCFELLFTLSRNERIVRSSGGGLWEVQNNSLHFLASSYAHLQLNRYGHVEMPGVFPELYEAPQLFSFVPRVPYLVYTGEVSSSIAQMDVGRRITCVASFVASLRNGSLCARISEFSSEYKSPKFYHPKMSPLPVLGVPNPRYCEAIGCYVRNQYADKLLERLEAGRFLEHLGG